MKSPATTLTEQTNSEPASTSKTVNRPKQKFAPIDKRLDAFLTALFLGCCLGAVYQYASLNLLPLFLGCLLVTALFIRLIKFFSMLFGRALSNTLLSGAPFNSPLNKRYTMNKWNDTCWQFIVHLSMSIFELYVISDESWYAMPISVWIPRPREQVTKNSVMLLYALQIAIWIATGFGHRFIEERRKDYVVMFIHHIMTILLLLCSQAKNFHRIGVLVLLIHDVSDITVDLLKVSYYLKLQNWQGFFLSEIIFVINLSSWVYFRFYIFVTRVLYTSSYLSHVVLFRPGQKLWNSDNDMEFIYISNVLLFGLLTLHIWWFFLFCRIGYKALVIDPHSAGESEYEGESGSDKDA